MKSTIEISDAVEILTDWMVYGYGHCHYYEEEIDEAISVALGALEPHVLTLEEARMAMRTEPVIWFETAADGMVAGVRMNGTDYFTMQTDEVADEDDLDGDEVEEYYNKKFRLWSTRPTDEQRAVAEWGEVS